jgi:hypothetical protein
MDAYTLATMLMGLEQDHLHKVAQYLARLDPVTAEFLQDQLGVELFDSEHGWEVEARHDVTEAQEWHDFDPDC